jgi:hypothetical protein
VKLRAPGGIPSSARQIFGLKFIGVGFREPAGWHGN